MAEATLSMTFQQYRQEVGDFMSHTPAAAAWAGADSARRIDSIVKQGYRQFLYPPTVPDPDNQGRVVQWEWSFLKPMTTIGAWAEQSAGVATGTSGTTLNADDTIFVTDGTMVGQTISFTASGNTYTIASVTDTDTAVLDSSLASADEDVGDAFKVLAGDYALPDDFGGIEGTLTFDTTTGYPDIEMVDINRIRRERQDSRNISTFRPRLAAIVPRTTSGLTTGQRFDLSLWPTPDASYTLHYRKVVLVDMMTETNKYPLGGSAHSQTLLFSCLAIAERYIAEKERDYQRLFEEALAASIQRDRRLMTGRFSGYNADRSDALHSDRWGSRYRNYYKAVTYNDVQY